MIKLPVSRSLVVAVITTMIIIFFLLSTLILIFIYTYSFVTRGICKCSGHLVNKVVIVTGANSGMGYEIAKDMAERGARVIIACRNEQRALNAVNKIKEASRNADVHFRHLDLASFSSVRKFASETLESEKRLDILINNAGINVGASGTTEEGHSTLCQTNYFGPFLLTSLLIPLLTSSAPSRIINISSFTHHMVFNFDPCELKEVPASNNFITNSFWYFKTKLCVNLMTFELARRLHGSGVTVNCLHPGAVRTTMLKTIDSALIRHAIKLCVPFFKTAWEGAQTAIFLAVSPDLMNSSGGYYSDCKLINTSKLSQNLELAQSVFEVTENLANACRNS